MLPPPRGSLLTASCAGSAIGLSLYVAFIGGGGSKEGLAPFGYLSMFRDTSGQSCNPISHFLLFRKTKLSTFSANTGSPWDKNKIGSVHLFLSFYVSVNR